MQKIKFKNLNFKILQIFILLYFSILIGFYFNEDSLGGAQNDFNYHYKISLEFVKNFLSTFNDFGTRENQSMGTRNSPLFWMIVAQMSKFFSYDMLRIINSSVSIIICFYFFKCLKIRYKKINNFILALLACSIYLSPTIRSLSIWPYSLIWGLLFFVISTFHFLKFLEIERDSDKFIQSLITIFFIVISAYIYPAFGIFFFIFIINFFLFYRFGKKFFLISIFSFILAIPFLFYVNSKDVLAAFDGAQGITMNKFNTFNISNKILIISSMIFFFIAPILNFKLVKKEIASLNSVEVLILITFGLINIYFFNYPEYDSGFGGGFFYKFSNIFFKNNYLFFLFSIFALIYIYTIIKKNFNNSVIFLTLILFNPQLTIYNKYYDPLTIIVFTTLISFDIKKHFFKKKYNILQLYFFCVSYLVIGLLKNQIY